MLMSTYWFSPGSIAFTALLMVFLSGCSREDKVHPQAEVNNTGAWSVADYQGKPVTEQTRDLFAELATALPNGDFDDGSAISDHAREELIAELPVSLGEVDFSANDVTAADASVPVHPNLVGYAQQIQKTRGLFKLQEGVYQIRGGLAYITAVRGSKGWIILDTGMTTNFAEEAWAFAMAYLPGGADVPISAVIYSHSHVDHFGGVKGLISQADADAGRVSVIAPFGFMAHALAENVIAGSAMFRRASYHFGSLLTPKTDGTEYYSFIPAETGQLSLIRPTTELPEGPGQVSSLDVDGVTIEFMDVSGAEAPSATLIYLPGKKLLFNSELMFHGLHNVYTLRGAQVRDALFWSKLINQVIENWGVEIDCITGPHGPSFCGNAPVNEYMRIQRDNYGFIHNQTVRLINSGTKLQDAGGLVEGLVPESLAQVWHTHGFHGTYSHNARGVVNRYLGFYDGNPANLNPLPTKEEAKKFVEYMGGATSILDNARRDIAQGDYRFAATALNKLVTAEPHNWPARHLLADAFEQLGYQAEGPQWRNAYLTAAKELRVGEVLVAEHKNDAGDLFSAASAEELLDAMAVRVNVSKAEGKNIRVILRLTDVGELWWLELTNGNLSAIQIDAARPADAELTLPLSDLVKLLTGQVGLKGALDIGASVEGSRLSLASLLLVLEKNQPNYPLVGG
jgi:linear primary-alkylsulfatase